MPGPSVGTNLAGITDWGSAFPFIDHFRTARLWLTDTWQPFPAGVLDLDRNGWVRNFSKHGGALEFVDDAGEIVSYSAVSTVLFTGTGGLRPAGRYILDYEGRGELSFDFGGATVVRSAPGRIVLDLDALAADDTSLLKITIESTDPGDSGDYIRNIRLYEKAHADLIAAGEMFQPAFIDKIGDFRALRFMDWGATNDSALSAWSDRPAPGAAQWTAGFPRGGGDPVAGVPVEVMVRLANETGADPWFCIPHLADADYVRRFVTYVHDHLDPDLVARFEYSNEAWNWLFDVAHWSLRRADRRWGDGDPATDDVEGGWMQYYGMKAARVAGIVAEVYGAETGTRALNVFSTQAGWPGLEHYALEAPDLVAAGGAAPKDAPFHVYAIASYFGGSMGGADMADTVDGWIVMNRADPAGTAGYDAAIDWLRTGGRSDTLDRIGEMFAYHAAVAGSLGWRLESYEGGQHIVDADGLGGGAQEAAQTAFFVGLNAHPEMQRLYDEWLGIWKDSGGGLVAQFSDFGVPDRFGSWGIWDSPHDVTDGPRAAAIVHWRDSVAAWWDDPRPAAVFARGIYADGTAGADTLRGTRRDDRLYALAGDDRLAGREGADRLYGADGLDLIRGGAGRDALAGGDGADVLHGGRGNDRLAGGAGGDVFVFADGFGQDRVSDFGVGRDRIDLRAVAGIGSFADLRAGHLARSGPDTIIDDGAGNTITLAGIDADILGAKDFLF